MEKNLKNNLIYLSLYLSIYLSLNHFAVYLKLAQLCKIATSIKKRKKEKDPQTHIIWKLQIKTIFC